MDVRPVNESVSQMNELIPEDNGATSSLEPIAMVALDAGRMLMEAGANARNINELVEKIACGLGADRVDLRIGYASLGITIGIGPSGITRMRRVGHLGVNQRADQALRRLAGHVATGEMTATQTRTELTRIATTTPRHSAWVMAVAVGLACAAFGRLLGVDWLGTGPVFLAATIGQFTRRELLTRHVNVFIGATLVSFLSSSLAGLGALWAGSTTQTTAMIAAILLLVPGVPSVNAQSDILDGHPTLGSARSVSVAVILIFLAAGLWLGEALLAKMH